ncbi:MAG TPA: PorV/PorQ family protein [bacterium]|nr:PorV/PorQ family protein [bacterium]
MPKSRFLLVVAVAVGVIGCAYPAFCADPHAGPYLRMGVGARALGMGGAFTAISDDATAAYWNPAGLAKIENIEATFMYAANMAVDRQLNYAAYAQWLGVGGLGVSWLNAGMSDMPKRDNTGTSLGTDDYADNAIMFSYGMEVGSMMLGGTAKILHQNIMGTTETGFGVDVGGLLNVSDNVTAGLMIRDIGSQYGDVDVPLDWRFGTAVKALDGGLTVGLDCEKVQNIDHFTIHLGAEYGMEVHPGYHAFFRSGVQSAEHKAFTAGLGIRVPYVQFDYAFVSEKNEDALGDNHRVSVTARF